MRRSLPALALSSLLVALLASSPAQADRNPLSYTEPGGCGGTAPYTVYCQSSPTYAWTSRHSFSFSDSACVAPAGCVATFVGSLFVELRTVGGSAYVQYDCTYACERLWGYGSFAAGDDVILGAWVGPYDGCHRVTVTVPPHEPGVSACPPVAQPATGAWGVAVQFY